MDKKLIEEIRGEMGLESLLLITNEGDYSLESAIGIIEQASRLLKIRKKLHKAIVVFFANRFADLSKFISDYELYARAAKHFAVNSDISGLNVENILSNQEIVAINLSIQIGLGDVIVDPVFFDACDLQISASSVSKSLSEIASNSVSRFAPNLSKLVGKEIAALLLSFAGGIQELAQSPPCNIKTFGAKKIGLLGFSSRSTGNHQGVLYHSEIVRTTSPEFRDSVFRDLANKSALCARLDMLSSHPDGSYGEKLLSDLSTKLDKKQNNKAPKYIKPIPIPGLEKNDKRGGRKSRAMKKKFGMPVELKLRQRVALGIDGQYDESGTQFGMSALENITKVQYSKDSAFDAKIDKKMKALDKAFKQ